MNKYKYTSYKSIPESIKKKVVIDYKSGISGRKLEKLFKISSWMVYKIFKEAKIKLRNKKEAQAMLYKMDPEFPKRRVIKNIGRVVTKKEKEYKAKSKENNAVHNLSFYEKQFKRILDKEGIKYIPQKTFDIFNVDFYLPKFNTCIEIFGGGNLHWKGIHLKNFKRKLKVILPLTNVFVINANSHSCVKKYYTKFYRIKDAIPYLLKFIKYNKNNTGKYGVVWGKRASFYGDNYKEIIKITSEFKCPNCIKGKRQGAK